MALVTVRWNSGMTVATVLLITGALVVVLAEDQTSPLYPVGVGILALASIVYLVARIWMLTRKSDR